MSTPPLPSSRLLDGTKREMRTRTWQELAHDDPEGDERDRQDREDRAREKASFVHEGRR